MTVFDDYRTRVSWSGTSNYDAYDVATISFINQQFASSPTYMSVLIDGTSTDIRLLRNQMDVDNPHVKRIMFRPGTTIQEGSVAVIGNDNWLVIQSSKHPLYPTAEVYQCNSLIKWKDNNGTIYQYPCVFLQSKKDVIVRDDKLMELAKFETKVFATYNNDTANIKGGLRLLFGNQSYRTTGTDVVSMVFDDYGITALSVELDTINQNDDFANQIADNYAYYMPQGEPLASGSKWGSEIIG